MSGRVDGSRSDVSTGSIVPQDTLISGPYRAFDLILGKLNNKQLRYLKAQMHSARKRYDKDKGSARENDSKRNYDMRYDKYEEARDTVDYLKKMLQKCKSLQRASRDSTIEIPYHWARVSALVETEVELDQATVDLLVDATNGPGTPGLTGLENKGNWCYMNACLQPLSALPQLRDYFRDKFLNHINRVNHLGTKGRVAANYAAVQLFLWSGEFKIFNPHRLLFVIGEHCSTFADNQQHDAQEFLVTLLDTLHEDVNRVICVERGEQQNDNKPLVTAGREAWEMWRKFGRSYIYSLFEGQAVSIIKCNKCSATSTKFDTFTQVTLDLPTVSECTLQECLSEHYKDEDMEGDQCWKCTKCKKLQSATKTMRLWRLPPVLIVHLKRFEQDGQILRKKETDVKFPLHSFSLIEYLHRESEQQPKSYSLFAVTYHKGSMTRGHYTALCRHPGLNEWYYFDDHEFAQVLEKEITSSSAYILYYKSTSPLERFNG